MLKFHISDSFWCEYKDKYLGGYPEGVTTKTGDDYLLVREMCLETSGCGGITLTGGKFEMRAGTELKTSSTGEVSYKICSKGEFFVSTCGGGGFLHDLF